MRSDRAFGHTAPPRPAAAHDAARRAPRTHLRFRPLGLSAEEGIGSFHGRGDDPDDDADAWGSRRDYRGTDCHHDESTSVRAVVRGAAGA